MLQAVHNFNGTTEKELSLIVGDYVVVRQVSVPIVIRKELSSFVDA